MATSKWEAFSPAENDIARLAKALAHPARVRILLEIARRAACSGSDLQLIIPLSQSTVSQHIKDLVKAGLLHSTPRGPMSLLSVDWGQLARLTAAITEYLADIAHLEIEYR